LLKTKAIKRLVAAAVEKDLQIYVQTLAAVHDTLAGTTFNTILDDLGLIKKECKMGYQAAFTRPDGQDVENVGRLC
jgi:hypothetical protein